jgi:hypothetical protein
LLELAAVEEVQAQMAQTRKPAGLAALVSSSSVTQQQHLLL